MMRRAKAWAGSQTTSATKATSKDCRHFWRGELHVTGKRAGWNAPGNATLNMAASPGRSHTQYGHSGGPPTPNLRWHYFRRLLSRRKRKLRWGGGGRKSLSRFSVPLNHKNRRRAGVSEPRPGRLSRRWRCAVVGKWRGPGLPPPRPSLSGSGNPGGLERPRKECLNMWFWPCGPCL